MVRFIHLNKKIMKKIANILIILFLLPALAIGQVTKDIDVVASAGDHVNIFCHLAYC